jgi:hypothetical protein
MASKLTNFDGGSVGLLVEITVGGHEHDVSAGGVARPFAPMSVAARAISVIGICSLGDFAVGVARELE